MTPRLTFHGAARAVTGSCFRLEAGAGQLLIDCGMFQGSKTEKELNYRAFPFRPDGIAAAILTHAHIDHSGLLPKLVKDGFAGPIHATAATADLASVMLPDSAHIQAIEVEQLNRRKARWSAAPVEPIYTGADADACLGLFRRESYGSWFDVLPGVRARFWNAGHLLGSASVEIEIAGAGAGPERPLRLLFSGDIGPDFKLLHPDPEAPRDLDYVVCEATYGDTDRPEATDASRRALLGEEVRAAIHPNGALLIPSFAVERAQELIVDLTRLMAEGELPQIPIHVDSPLASRATRIFARHARELEEGAGLLAGLRSRQVHFTETVEQSKALDRQQGFHIVIAASGMCEAGRIRHRLKNWIWRDEATVLFVGYQAEGTLGRILQDGASTVRIQGEDFPVRARIRSIDLYSGHADGPELAEWIRERLPIAREVFLVHGEPPAMDGLAARLAGVLDPDRVLTPVLDEGFELAPAGARSLPPAGAPRLPSERVARLDWHNDVSRLILDINDALADAADERARDVLIRRLRRALDDGGAEPRKRGS
ncbi:MBL fold metallo-hydrolase [Amaricoccus sp.]|uniref:MBL fold metallo-hydrolase RNA specificity domain-containing protein n=1 Tax=Amaricoccus sp. TaxID=1872485 RepID=UPI001B48DABB|nr:MBL fold metallo-hydrolase [Amaricoccus sp.]MBP7240794.1 MBL fold metallo-hydrolase [Amaricoccus sp.]